MTSVVVTLLALQAAGSGGGPDCRPQSAAVREARAVATGIVDADNARDLERVLGAARALDDVFVMLLQRSADGAFRISHLVWHRASAAERP